VSRRLRNRRRDFYDVKAGSARTRQGSALHLPPFVKGGRKLFIYLTQTP